MRMNAIWIGRTARLTARLAMLAPLAACNFDVTNPGPVEEQYLANPAAVPAIVNGAGRDLSHALNYIAYVGGAVAREIFPAGSTGSFGVSAREQIGRLDVDQSNAYWNFAQRARFEAEHGDSTIKAALAPDAYAKDPRVAQLKLWAGYSNRLLGENMCEATNRRRTARAVHGLPHPRRAALHRRDRDRHRGGQRTVRQRRARGAGGGARGPRQLGRRGDRRRGDPRRVRLPDAVLHDRRGTVEPHL